MRLVSVVGARPQFVKLAPVVRVIQARQAAGEPIEHRVVHTGQHYDASMSDVFFRELGLPEPAANLGVGSGTHAEQTAAMLAGLERSLLALSPDAVVVYGDTNSTLAGALAATKLGLPTAHVEAGLRSGNRRMPEELNRVATDHLCDLLLAPTRSARSNLVREGLEDRTLLVGDVMLDAVLHNLALARDRSDVLGRLDLERTDFAVATIHRAGNTEPDVLSVLLEALVDVARIVPVVLPLHPRTRAVLDSQGRALVDTPRLRVIDPLPYLDMVRLVDGSVVVLTDSGGLQKEAFILGRPCVTLREETEWTETLEAGANVLAGSDGRHVRREVEAWAQRGWGRADGFNAQAFSLYGEGMAAQRIVEAVGAMAVRRS